MSPVIKAIYATGALLHVLMAERTEGTFRRARESSGL